MPDIEKMMVKLQADFDNHVKLCEARMHVLWKMAALLAATIALLVSTATMYALR